MLINSGNVSILSFTSLFFLLICSSFRPIANRIKSIQITGNFDNWSRSLPTQSIEQIKQNNYTYTQKIKLPTKEKLIFKFVVNDSNWITNQNLFRTEHDSSGVENNVIDSDKLIEFHEFEQAPVEASPAATSAAPAQTESEETYDEVVTEKDFPAESPVVIGTEDDGLLSDYEAKSPTSTSTNTFAASKSNTDNLTQVLTGSSSFAAVSIPSSSNSTNDYENLNHNSNIDNVIDDFSTPTNSVLNSTVLPERSQQTVNKPNLLSINSESTLSNASNVPKDSVSSAADDDDVVEILKAPGGYPTTPEKSIPNSNSAASTAIPSRTADKTRRGENLISRFKSLFRY
ncbi:uncharacterized protein RJT21DRAFT_116411 [Scheffersomyces amazonensis]|uniref:uncharacterized protein n=1 Tax=Scheffersomyces amazonensis TaxID=1078765 RepID=UPI00315D25C2